VCESRAILLIDGEERTVLDDVVDLVVLEDGSVKLVNIEGRELVLRDAALYRIDFINHRIYFVKKR